MTVEQDLKFNYVNVGYEIQGDEETYFNRKTVTLEKVPALKKEYSENFYITVWKYPGKEWQRHAEEGRLIGPFYADIDSEDLKHARKSAMNLVNFFLSVMKVPRTYIVLSFSGNKGFHVKIPHEAMGAEPSEKLPQAYGQMAENLKKICPDLDLGVYDNKRLLRAVNTVNGKSNLYKIPITIQELYTSDMEEIKEMAKKPRRPIHRNRLNRIQLKEVKKLKKFYRKNLRKAKQKPEQRVVKNVEEPIIEEVTPCIKGLLQGVKRGERNEASLRLASFLHNKGIEKEKTKQKLLQWNQKNKPPIPDKEVLSTIKSAYQKGYNFGCKDYLLNKYCRKENCPIVGDKHE